MQILNNRLFCLGGWTIVTILMHPMTGYAQTVVNQLPPPPSVSVPELQPLPTPGFPNFVQQETVFQSPSASQFGSYARYLVVVNGQSPYLLQMVQAIEPGATTQFYQGRPVILAGQFSDEESARQRVASLNMQGIGADVVTVSPTPGLSQPQAAPISNYTIVIPGVTASLTALAEQTVQLGVRPSAIQQKMSPRGPHLEIGPFTSYSEAQEVNRYLRQQGKLDSRVIYSR